jgi:penicillin-binding protein
MKLSSSKTTILLLFMSVTLVACSSDSEDDENGNEDESLCAELSQTCSSSGNSPVQSCSGSLQDATEAGCETEFRNWLQCINQSNCDPASCTSEKTAYQQCGGNTGGDDASSGDTSGDDTSGDSSDTDSPDDTSSEDSTMGSGDDTSDGSDDTSGSEDTSSSQDTSNGGLCSDLSNACSGTGANPISDCQSSRESAQQNSCGTEYDSWVQCIVDNNCDPASCQTEESAYNNCGGGSNGGSGICTDLDNACSGTGTDPAPNCSQTLQDAKDDGCETEYTSWLQCIVDINCDPASCQDKESAYQNCTGS